MLLTNANLNQAKKIAKENENCVSSTPINIGNNNITMSISQGLAEVKNNERIESVLQRVFKDLTMVKLKSTQ